MVDNEKAGQQAVSRTKPIRGISWTEIFRNRPELEPPGYAETVRYMEIKRRLGSQD